MFVGIKLKSGVVGYFEPKSNVHLAVDSPEASVDTEMVDCSGLKKAYEGTSCPFIVEFGSLTEPKEEYISDNVTEIKPPTTETTVEVIEEKQPTETKTKKRAAKK
jgi:hypothetical protein